MQNPSLLEGPFLLKLHLSKPRDLLSAPPIAPTLVALYPYGGSSPSPGGLHLHTSNSLSEVQGFQVALMFIVIDRAKEEGLEDKGVETSRK